MYVYYFAILVCEGVLAIKIACGLMKEMNQEQVMIMAFIVSIAVSGMLCSIQYIKRLYKACLTNRIEIHGDIVRCIGNITYFIFRPFFAFAFSVLMVFMLLSGMFIVTGNLDYVLNEKFIYV